MNCPNCKGVLDPACGLCNGRGTVIPICNYCGKAEPHCKCYPLRRKSTRQAVEDAIRKAKDDHPWHDNPDYEAFYKD